MIRSSSPGTPGFSARGGFPLQDRAHRVERRSPLEGRLSRHHLVERRAEREDVGARVDPLTPRLLGGHVGRGPENPSLLSHLA